MLIAYFSLDFNKILSTPNIIIRAVFTFKYKSALIRQLIITLQSAIALDRMRTELIRKIKTNKGYVYLIDSDLYNIDRNQFRSKKDFQAQVVRLFLTAKVGDHVLNHNDSGAPFLVDSNYHLSISHCDHLFAIYLSSFEFIGVDIEVIKKDIQKIIPYFINQQERNTNWTFEQLYIIWCTKEAVYKSKKGNIRDLAAEVTVKSITNNEVIYTFKTQVEKLTYEITDNWVLTYN